MAAASDRAMGVNCSGASFGTTRQRLSSSLLALVVALVVVASVIVAPPTAEAFQPPRFLPQQRPLSPRAAARPMHRLAAASMTTTTAATSAAPRIDPSALAVPQLKQRILQLAAAMDRGKLQDPLVAEQEGGLYQAEKEMMVSLLEALVAKGAAGGKSMKPELLDGDWELVYTTRQLFRSSPFFQAIARAYNDPSKSELFFKLHELQTCSWGVSQIGRVAQSIDLAAGTLVSEFDSIIFGLTVIPIVGWFKLLPTFGGRVVSIADGVKVTEEEASTGGKGKALRLEYELAKTSFEKVKGLGVMPLVGDWMAGKKFPTKEVWKLLPWNWGGDGPRAAVRVVYLDEDFRVVSEEEGAGPGGFFVYARPLL